MMIALMLMLLLSANLTPVVSLNSNLLFPNQTLILKMNFPPSHAILQTPTGIVNLPFEKRGKEYVAEFPLKKDVVLGNYTVIMDGIVKHFVVDYYTINASFNGTHVIGTVKYYFVPPKFVNYSIDCVKGKAKVVKGKFSIPIPTGKHVVKLVCGNAILTMKVERFERRVYVDEYGFVNESINVKSNFKPSKAFVLFGNKTYNLTFEKSDSEYIASFKAKDVGVYKVVVDDFNFTIPIDDYRINASFNGTHVMGKVRWHFVKPKEIFYTLIPSNESGKVELENGTFDLDLGNDTGVILKCGNAVLKVERNFEIEIVKSGFNFVTFKTLLNGKSVKSKVSAFLNGKPLKVLYRNGSYEVRFNGSGVVEITAEYLGLKAFKRLEYNLSLNAFAKFENGSVVVFGNTTLNGESVNASVLVKYGNYSKVSHGEFVFKFPFVNDRIEIIASYGNTSVRKVLRLNPLVFDVKVSGVVWINGTSKVSCEYELDGFKGRVFGNFSLPFKLKPGRYNLTFTCGNFTTSKSFDVRGREVYVGGLYFPNDTVKIETNFKPSKAFVQNSIGIIYNLTFTEFNGTYVAEFPLKKDVVLGNYTVVVDGIVKHFVVDYYTINASFNGTSIVGNVSWFYVKPKFLNYSILSVNVSDTAKIVNGSFVIPIKGLKDGIYIVYLNCGNAKVKLNIKVINKKKNLRFIFAYDPTEKEIVAKVVCKDGVNVRTIKDSLFKDIKTKIYLKSLKFRNLRVIEFKIPATKETIRKLNFPYDVLNTSVKIKKISKYKIRLELNNKIDVWYRFKVKLPKGYRVKEIVGDDGRKIVNTLKINRSTGEFEGELRWYVENGTLYFYDDPIWGYNITLIPPQPNKSIAVELAYSGYYAGPGQISAIVYPYNSTDNSDTISIHDHAGRTEDNWANDIDIDAGSKIAIKFTLGGTTYQYGNWYFYYRYFFLWGYVPIYDTLGNNGNLTLINRTDVSVNTAPNGALESVIIERMQTSGGEVNVTQKVIIRGDEKWFATIYYIQPVSENLTNVRFFQGMDWNFNGDYRNDSCYYNSTFDVVYGHSNDTTLGEIEYGGYSSYLPSSAHDVGYFTDVYNLWGSLIVPGIWGNISRDSLSNNSFYNGDAATVLAWDKGTLNKSEIWVIPIIWGLGYNYTDMIEEIQKGKSVLYDVGIKSLDFPENNSNFNPSVTDKIYVNATVALYGLVDVYNLNVTMNVTQLDGMYTYESSKLVNLSVPFNETAQVSFPLNISSMPYGVYKISIKTNLPNDQNTTNDEKWIVIYITSFTVEPDQVKIGNAGEEVFYNITVFNYYSNGKFDINITKSTKGWATRIYDNGTLVAEDSNGDGSWDYIDSSYDTNGNDYPDIFIPYGTKNITISKLIPAGTPLGEVDYTTLDFSSISNPEVHDDVTLVTETPQPPTVLKTFYLHSITLNTTQPTSEEPTVIQPDSLSSWQQIPQFADDFNVVGTINVSLWLNSSTISSHTVTVSLIYTNGVTSYTLGTQTKTVYLSTVPELETFGIELTSQNEIPRNYYLVLRVENTQTSYPIYVFHNSTYPSNVTLNTTTYVTVQSVITDKQVYPVNETAYILANVTDPIGSYDISSANITVYYPNGSLYINDFMNLNATDQNTPSLWKLYSYSVYLPVTGIYNITVCGIESNGVSYCYERNLTVIPILNVLSGITAFWQKDHLNVTINVKAYRDMRNVTVYWIKPDNFTVKGMSGGYDENGSDGDYYWWRFYDLKSGDVRTIYINVTPTNDFRILEVYNIGVDPK